MSAWNHGENFHRSYEDVSLDLTFGFIFFGTSIYVFTQEVKEDDDVEEDVCVTKRLLREICGRCFEIFNKPRACAVSS